MKDEYRIDDSEIESSGFVIEDVPEDDLDIGDGEEESDDMIFSDDFADQSGEDEEE
jgi:hypothetical protein